MAKTDTDRYSITIGPQHMVTSTLEYYIEAKGCSLIPRLSGSAKSPYKVYVSLPVIPIPMVMVLVMRRMRSPTTRMSQVISTGMVLEIIPIRMMMGMAY